jgi:hypothetical protein
VRQQLDGSELVKIGDVVYVRAVVKRVLPENLLVELFSKTDQYEAWVRPTDCELDLPELPLEPTDGHMLTCHGPNEVDYIFRRDDENGLADGSIRRHVRRWWSYVDQTWVDWPYVVSHGGRDAVILKPVGD